MTFLFEDFYSGDFRFVSASDLSEAIDTFESYKSPKDSSDSTDFSGFRTWHVYVRIF